MQLEIPNSQMSEISVEITDTGVRRVTIYADDADQQARARRLLARIASEMVQLDRALKASPRGTALIRAENKEAVKVGR